MDPVPRIVPDTQQSLKSVTWTWPGVAEGSFPRRREAPREGNEQLRQDLAPSQWASGGESKPPTQGQAQGAAPGLPPSRAHPELSRPAGPTQPGSSHPLEIPVTTTELGRCKVARASAASRTDSGLESWGDTSESLKAWKAGATGLETLPRACTPSPARLPPPPGPVLQRGQDMRLAWAEATAQLGRLTGGL